MHVENPLYRSELFDKYFQASKEAGYKANPDFNDWSRSQEGYGEFQMAVTSRGRRADSYRNFLKPALGRDNLEVVIRTQVSKIVFETRNGTPTAVGVDVQGILVRSPALLSSVFCECVAGLGAVRTGPNASRLISTSV